MTDKVILFVDNDPTALAQGAEFLEADSYSVIRVMSAAEATHIIETRRIHLAILDLRLEDEASHEDLGGLRWAQTTAKALPKLIYTKFPTIEVVRAGLILDAKGTPSVVDVVDKRDGLPPLLEAVNAAFGRNVRLNWELKFDRQKVDEYMLLNAVESDLEPGLRNHRAEELLDLFRRLFLHADRVQLGRLLWQRGGRAAVTAFPFAGSRQLAPVVVVCGPAAIMENEARRFDVIAPSAPGAAGTARSGAARSIHYGALAYGLAGADLESTKTLAELFEANAWQPLEKALEGLFGKTLPGWHQNSLEPADQHLGKLFVERLGLKDGALTEDSLKPRMDAVAREAARLRTRFERGDGKFSVQFDGHTYEYDDPMMGLPHAAFGSEPIMMVRSPGTLIGSNILANESGNAWLTDFAEAGYAPEIWHFICLEAAARFDWVDRKDKELRWLHDFETALTGPHFSRLDLNQVEHALRPAMRAIRAIRSLAVPLLGPGGERAYYAGLYCQALGRLAEFEPETPLTPIQVARLAHVLLAAAILVSWLNSAEAGAVPATAGLRLDEERQQVHLGGQVVKLPGQAFGLLRYFCQQPSRVITKEELVREVFGVSYFNESEGDRLNTAIHRLRQRIEANPDSPQYVISIGGGYLFNPQPDR